MADSHPETDHSAIISTNENQSVSFPQFTQLPIELRELIWKHFCPELSRQHGRIICLALVRIAPLTHQVMATPGLDEQTRALRAMMSTHRESRELGLRFFPEVHTMSEGGGDIRYNADRDRILFHFRLIKGVSFEKKIGAASDSSVSNKRQAT